MGLGEQKQSYKQQESVLNSQVNKKQLFIGSCFALIATSVAFATVGDVMGSLKKEFLLTNLDIGYIGGAALWGFAVSNIIFAPLCDTLGMRFLVRLAFAGHVIGVLMMIFAIGFPMLFAGALVIAMANGLVEAACNPLVATLFPDDKAVKLNQFHVWFPGGAVIGGLGSYFLTQMGIGNWQIKLLLILVFTLIYGYMLLTKLFPDTEGVQSGVSLKESFKATVLNPFFLLMLFCMGLTASIELGPNRWVPAVLQAGGIPGILVLVWISGLMAVMRYYAKGTIGKLSPTIILLLSSIVSGAGLLWLSFAETTVMAFISATVFAVGVSYFWPTMLGYVNERIPKSGALGLGLMGGMGMAVVGLITSPQMGNVADYYAETKLPYQQTQAVLASSVEELPVLAEQTKVTDFDANRAVIKAKTALKSFDDNNETLSPLETMNALRAITDTGGDAVYVREATAILGRADNYGGRISFRYVVPVSLLLTIIFGALFWRDRKYGGYAKEQLNRG